MKSAAVLTGLAALANGVVGHATFQQLWVNGQDQGTTCVRMPNSNSPITSVTSNDIRCNANSGPVAGKCAVPAGGTVTVEMHQHNDRSCSQEAIGGAHHGPVMVYMSKVSNAATADGSTPFFKVFQDTWAKNPSGGSGSDDFWGTKDLNTNCGKMDVRIPSNLAPGDYLLRAEAIALHAAGSAGGAQFYVSCYQITVTGGGSNNPAGVSFPGAYRASDPGIQINIYTNLNSYVAPGPAVIAGGTEAVAGKAGSTVTAAPGAPQTTAAPPAQSTLVTSARPVTSAAPGGCAAQKYQQCGGTGYSGCTTCVSGTTCNTVNPYYHQCL